MNVSLTKTEALSMEHRAVKILKARTFRNEKMNTSKKDNVGERARRSLLDIIISN